MILSRLLTRIAIVTSLLLPAAALASDITVRVSGMVCAFCAAGIEKSFNANEAVETVNVDLNKKVVTLKTKADSTLTNEEIGKIIVNSGYNVVAIER